MFPSSVFFVTPCQFRSLKKAIAEKIEDLFEIFRFCCLHDTSPSLLHVSFFSVLFLKKFIFCHGKTIIISLYIYNFRYHFITFIHITYHFMMCTQIPCPTMLYIFLHHSTHLYCVLYILSISLHHVSCYWYITLFFYSDISLLHYAIVWSLLYITIFSFHFAIFWVLYSIYISCSCSCSYFFPFFYFYPLFVRLLCSFHTTSYTLFSLISPPNSNLTDWPLVLLSSSTLFFLLLLPLTLHPPIPLLLYPHPH